MSRIANLDIALRQRTHLHLRPHAHQLSTPGDWAGICSALFLRHTLRQENLGDVCKDLGLDHNAAEYLLGVMRAHREASSGRNYRSEMDTEAIPPCVKRSSARRAADDIGRAIIRVAKANVPLVARVISIYASAANTDKQIVMDPAVQRHINYGIELITLVHALKITTLGFQLVGFKNAAGQQADLSAACTALRLPDDTPRRTLKARNSKAASSAQLVGLEVVHTTSSGRVVVDGPFFVGMMLAAAVEALAVYVAQGEKRPFYPSKSRVTSDRASVGADHSGYQINRRDESTPSGLVAHGGRNPAIGAADFCGDDTKRETIAAKEGCRTRGRGDHNAQGQKGTRRADARVDRNCPNGDQKRFRRRLLARSCKSLFAAADWGSFPSRELL